MADVLKHTVLCAVLDAVRAKASPVCYIDTHAGPGIYDLRDERFAGKEFESGIGRLWAQRDSKAAPEIQLYLRAVASENRGTLRHYPGSCAIAARLLEPPHRLVFCEQHASEHAALARRFARQRNARIVEGDGYAELKRSLPTAESRAIVLIDPAYERRDEQHRVIDGLQRALERMRHAVYLVWYPLTGKHDSSALLRALLRIEPPKTLKLELRPRTSAAPGAIASGILVLNPPFRAIEPLRTLLPYLQSHLAPGGTHSVDWLVAE